MFDIREKGMSDFEKNMEYIVENMPKEARMILRKGGSKARTIVARKARQLVKKRSKKGYHAGFKRGKVWQEDDGTYRVRVYNNAPHAHLIEDGHRIVGKDGSEHGFKQGLKVMEKANKEVEKQWDQILEKEIDNLLDKL